MKPFSLTTPSDTNAAVKAHQEHLIDGELQHQKPDSRDQ